MDEYKDTNKFSYYEPPITWKSRHVPTRTCTIEDIYNEIRGTSLKSITDTIRSLATTTERNKIKAEKLPFVSFGGVFSYRNGDHISEPSGYIVLDLDHFDEKGLTVPQMKNAILEKFQPVLMFTSPSGQGLKVVCKYDSKIDHADCYTELVNYFKANFNIKPDKGGDIARACFLSYDPNAYLSPNPTLFTYEFVSNSIEVQRKEPKRADIDEAVRRGIIWIETREGVKFTEGSRHNYLVLLTGFLNRAGIHIEQAKRALLKYEQPDFDKNEICGIVDWEYRKHAALHGMMSIKGIVGKEAYISFALELLWVPKAQFYDRIKTILSKSFEPTTGKIPTSIRIDYLEDCLNGKISPELLLLLAATKSKIGKHNYTRTTWECLWGRMWGVEYGGKPWRRFTEYYFNKLMNEAAERRFLSRLRTYPGMYISIKLNAKELADAVIRDKEKGFKRRQRVQNDAKYAAKRIADFGKNL